MLKIGCKVMLQNEGEEGGIMSAEKRKSSGYVCHSNANVLMLCLIASSGEG